MKKYLKKIERIKNKSFPILKNHKIIVIKSKSHYGIRVIYFYFFTLYIVGKGAEKGLSIGGIAHELSHLEMFKQWGLLKTMWFTFLQYFFDSYRRKVERGADLLAIKKGYGKELYKTRKTPQPKGVRKLLKKYYMPLDEIKKYTRNKK